ncbi:MAG: hypothetical protein ACXVHT_04880 [Methanobacterium sp.]
MKEKDLYNNVLYELNLSPKKYGKPIKCPNSMVNIGFEVTGFDLGCIKEITKNNFKLRNEIEKFKLISLVTEYSSL